MKRLERLTWNGFLGINKKADPFDIKDTAALDVTNLKLSRRVGALRRCPGLKTAVLGGASYTYAGLGGRTINRIGELVTSHQDADSPYYICQAGSDNKFYQWNSSTAQWDEITGPSTVVDIDVVKFIPRPNGLIAACGSGSTNDTVLFTFAGEQFTYGYSGGDKTITKVDAAIAAGDAELKKFDDLDRTVTIGVNTDGSAGGSTPAMPKETTIAYRFALQYDGFQWGPPSDTVYSATTPDAFAAISLYFGLTASALSQRITGIKIYRRVGYRGNPTMDKFYLFKTISVNDDIKWPGYFGSLNNLSEEAVSNNGSPLISTSQYPTPFGGSGTYLKAVYDGSLQFTMDNGDFSFGNAVCLGMLLGVKTSSFDADDLATADASFFDYLMPIGSSDNTGGAHINVLEDGSAPAGTYYIVPLYGWHYYYGKYYYGIYDSHEDLSAMPEMYEDLGFVAGEVADLNYELAVMLNKRQYVARLWDGFETNKATVRASAISGEGTYDYDVYHAEDVISVQEYGITEIMGLSTWRNDLIIFGKEDILIASPNTGNTFGWSVYDTLQRVGLAATDSISRALGDTYYMGNNGPFRFSEAVSEPIHEITDPDNHPLDVTDLSECISVLDNARDEVLMAFPSDNVIYCYDLIMRQWTKYDLPISPSILLKLNDDTLLIGDGTNLYQLDWDTYRFGTGYITPTYLSKELKFADTLIMPYAFEIRYNSDTDFQVKVYKDGTLWVTRTIPSGDGNAYQKLPAAAPCNKLQYSITMGSTVVDDNTTFEVRSFNLDYKLAERV